MTIAFLPLDERPVTRDAFLALAAIGGLKAFRERQHAARQEGRYLGLGIGCYVEGTGVGPFTVPTNLANCEAVQQQLDTITDSEGSWRST